jgi:hypothetical protein
MPLKVSGNHRNRDKMDAPNTHIHDCLLSWLDASNTHIHDCLLSWLDASNTHIHDCLLSWLDAPNTHIHDCLLSWLDAPNTHIHDFLLSWLDASNIYIHYCWHKNSYLRSIFLRNIKTTSFDYNYYTYLVICLYGHCLSK